MTQVELRQARLVGGDLVDVKMDGGSITSVQPANDSALIAEAGSIDLDGMLLVPAFGEPHAHLDKAYIADRVPNPAGDLNSAIRAIQAAWPDFSSEDISTRAAMAARRLVSSGTTLIRTHADLLPQNGNKSFMALLDTKAMVQHLCEFQVAPFTHQVSGKSGASGRKMLDGALVAGADVVGGCPHLDTDPAVAIDVALDAAMEYDRPVDFHFDEELDVAVQFLPDLARKVAVRDLGGRVAASHCVSHGLLPPDVQREIARALADAGVAVVTNPRTNLYLQARGIEQAPPRGLAGVRALLDEGVVVAGGADNVQDPFYVIGRSDPLETATFLVAVAHLTVDEAWRLVGAGVRAALGADPVEVKVGAPAELVAIRARSPREAIADQPVDRMVFHSGALVASTTSSTWIA